MCLTVHILLPTDGRAKPKHHQHFSLHNYDQMLILFRSENEISISFLVDLEKCLYKMVV